MQFKFLLPGFPIRACPVELIVNRFEMSLQHVLKCGDYSNRVSTLTEYKSRPSPAEKKLRTVRKRERTASTMCGAIFPFESATIFLNNRMLLQLEIGLKYFLNNQSTLQQMFNTKTYTPSSLSISSVNKPNNVESSSVFVSNFSN